MANSGEISISCFFLFTCICSLLLKQSRTNFLKSFGMRVWTTVQSASDLLRFQSQVLSGTLLSSLNFGKYVSISNFAQAHAKMSWTLKFGKCGTWIYFKQLFLAYYSNLKKVQTLIFPEITNAMYVWFACGSGWRYTSPSSCSMLFSSFLLEAFSEICFVFIFMFSITADLIINSNTCHWLVNHFDLFAFSTGKSRDDQKVARIDLESRHLKIH